MRKKLSLKPVINKRNNQITVNLKRKDLPKELLNKILDVKKLRLELE